MPCGEDLIHSFFGVLPGLRCFLRLFVQYELGIHHSLRSGSLRLAACFGCGLRFEGCQPCIFCWLLSGSPLVDCSPSMRSFHIFDRASSELMLLMEAVGTFCSVQATNTWIREGDFSGVACMLSQRSRDQLLIPQRAASSYQAEQNTPDQLDLHQLEAISWGARPFNWLCWHFQSGGSVQS